MKFFAFLDKLQDHGLLLLRVGIGGMFFFVHGWPKLLGGPEKWAKLGGAMQSVGVSGYPEIWGFMAAFSECIGGLCLMLGLFFRPAAALMFATMFVAATMHLSSGDGMGKSSHAIELGFVFLSLIFIGPGIYSLDKRSKSLRS